MRKSERTPHRIELNLREAGQLFNTMDPAPFPEKDLDGDAEAAAAQWVQPRRHQLRHGRQQPVLTEIAALTAPRGAAGEVVQREQNYFATHAGA